jgi:hypothetical protein
MVTWETSESVLLPTKVILFSICFLEEKIIEEKAGNTEGN